MRVLIIGIDGVIGGSLARSLRARGHNVAGTTRRKAHVDLPNTIYLDLAARDVEPPLPDADATVICAAMARFEECRAQPQLAWRVNVEQPIEIARKILSRGARVLLLSTSAVFDCLKPHREADDIRAPRSAYGRMKAEAEAGILALGGTVLRLTKVVTTGTGRLGDWIDALERGQSVRAFEDHRFCPIKLESVLDAVTAIVEQKSCGIFQLSGAEDISYADAARHLANRMGIPRDRVEGTFAVDNGVPEEEVTSYTSLDTSRLSALSGYHPLSPRKVIDDVFAASFATARAP